MSFRRSTINGSNVERIVMDDARGSVRNSCLNRERSRLVQVAVYSPLDGHCACVETAFEFETAFKNDKTECKCSLDTSNHPCRSNGQWHVLTVSNVIELVDSEVGM